MTSSSFTPLIVHSGSSTHTRNRLAFAPLRGVAAREMSAASSRYRTYEGVAPLAPPRRAHYRRRAGCLQPENSGPFVLAAAPICSCLCAPAPLCGAPAINLTSRQSHATHHLLIISPMPAHRSTASCPIRRATVLPCSEKKNGSGGQRRATVPLALHRPTRPPVREGQLQSPRLR